MLGGIEQCDPPAVGAGCSATCKLEPGFVCDAPPAVPDPTQPATLSPHRVRRRQQGRNRGVRRRRRRRRRRLFGQLQPRARLQLRHLRLGLRRRGQARPRGVRRRQHQGRRRLLARLPAGDRVHVHGRAAEPARAAQPARRPTATSSASRRAGSTRHPDFEIFAGMGITPLLVRPTLDAAREAGRRRALHAGRRHGRVSLRSAADDAGELRPVVPRHRQRERQRPRARCCWRGWPTGHTSTIRAAAASIRSTTRAGSRRRARPPRSPIRSSTTAARTTSASPPRSATSSSTGAASR